MHTAQTCRVEIRFSAAHLRWEHPSLWSQITLSVQKNMGKVIRCAAGGILPQVMLMCNPQALHGQSSIRNLSLRGPGELDLCRGSRFSLRSSCFDLGAVTYVTHLHVEADQYVYLCIPAAMRLQSLELYARSIALSAEDLWGWASDIVELRLVYTSFVFTEASVEQKLPDALELRGSPFWPAHSQYHIKSQRVLYAVLCEFRDSPRLKHHYERRGRAYNTLYCMVLEGCRFDNGMAAAARVYDGGDLPCSCCICWGCLQLENSLKEATRS